MPIKRSEIQHLHRPQEQPELPESQGVVKNFISWLGRIVKTTAIKFNLIRDKNDRFNPMLEMTQLRKRNPESHFHAHELRNWGVGEGSYGDVYMVRKGTELYVCKKGKPGKPKSLQRKRDYYLKMNDDLLAEGGISSEVHARGNKLITKFYKHAAKTDEREKELSSLFNSEYILAGKIENGQAYWKFAGGSVASLLSTTPDGKDLGNERAPLALKHVAIVGSQVLQGLKHMHDKGYCHRDIKWDNVVIDKNWNAKIIDLGLCEHFEEAQPSDCREQPSKVELKAVQVSTTPHILAPEAFQCKGAVDSPEDIWAFGIMLGEAVLGEIVFRGEDKDFRYQGETVEECMQDCLSRRQRLLNRLKEKNVNHEIVELVTGMLAVDPKDRMTAEEALVHPFFTNAQAYLEELRQPVALPEPRYIAWLSDSDSDSDSDTQNSDSGSQQ